MKKRIIITIMSAIMTSAVLAGCGTTTTSTDQASDTASVEKTSESVSDGTSASVFTPSTTVTFNISSKAGGNSDLFTRTISDICTKNDYVNQTIVVNNNTDGSGNIVRIETQNSSAPDETLLCFSSGDMQSMLDSDVGLTVDEMSPIAIMAADKQLIFAHAGSKYTSFDDIKAAIDAGTKINVGGTKSNEKSVFDMFAEELGSADSFNYMYYDSSSESITALMGDHIDLCMGSPAAAVAYVDSGDITPVVALSDTRFASPLDQAPTMEELGYNVVQAPVWRGIIASGSMSEDAQQYWADVFSKVAESPEWAEYLNNYLLSPYYCDLETTRQTMKQSQDDYLAQKEAE